MNKYICTNCGYVGSAAKEKKGNILIEIVLWCFAILPGLIYTIWRHSNRHLICKRCGRETLVPLDSPIGQKLTNEGK